MHGNQFILRREMETSNGKTSYFLDGRSITKDDLHNIFKMSELSNFNDVAKLVQIGKVNEISHLDQS